LSKEVREVTADWLMMLSAVVLFVSLFLTWSHQFSHAFLAQFGSSVILQGVPRDPTAWQVYSIADVLLAVLAACLAFAALAGSRAMRLATLGGCVLGLVFTLHAISAPPTNGANVLNPTLAVPSYFPNAPMAAAGETVAVIALAIAICSLVLSFTAD
jgi:hypothetical protein